MDEEAPARPFFRCARRGLALSLNPPMSCWAGQSPSVPDAGIRGCPDAGGSPNSADSSGHGVEDRVRSLLWKCSVYRTVNKQTEGASSPCAGPSRRRGTCPRPSGLQAQPPRVVPAPPEPPLPVPPTDCPPPRSDPAPGVLPASDAEMRTDERSQLFRE